MREERNILLVLLDGVGSPAVRRAVRRNLDEAAHVHVVAPTRVGTLDWLATDEDAARATAEVQALEAEWTLAGDADVEGEAGDVDPMLAVEDALRHSRTGASSSTRLTGPSNRSSAKLAARARPRDQVGAEQGDSVCLLRQRQSGAARAHRGDQPDRAPDPLAALSGGRSAELGRSTARRPAFLESPMGVGEERLIPRGTEWQWPRACEMS